MGQRRGRGTGDVVRRTRGFAGLLALLTGCAGGQPQSLITPLEVKVPVPTPVYCAVAKVDKPALPIAKLSADSPPDDTIRAYAATVAILKGAIAQRDLVLAGCGPPAPGAPTGASTPASTVVK